VIEKLSLVESFDQKLPTKSKKSGISSYNKLLKDGKLEELLIFLEEKNYGKDELPQYITKDINTFLKLRLTVDDLKGMINNYRDISKALGYNFKEYTEKEVLDVADFNKEVEDSLLKLATGYEYIQTSVVEQDVFVKMPNMDDKIKVMATKVKKTRTTKHIPPSIYAIELYLNLKKGKVKKTHKAIDITDNNKNEDYFKGLNIDFFDEVEKPEINLDEIGEKKDD
jgi:hypothetical protein